MKCALWNGFNIPWTRFYSTLYKKLLDPKLATSSHQALFLSLVFKALKKDGDIHRVRVFFKRLFQVSLILSSCTLLNDIWREKKDFYHNLIYPIINWKFMHFLSQIPLWKTKCEIYTVICVNGPSWKISCPLIFSQKTKQDSLYIGSFVTKI